MIAGIEDVDADTMLGQHEKVPEQMFLSNDAQLDGLPVPPPLQPPPEEVATPVDHGSTCIRTCSTLMSYENNSGRKATKSPTE